MVTSDSNFNSVTKSLDSLVGFGTKKHYLYQMMALFMVFERSLKKYFHMESTLFLVIMTRHWLLPKPIT